MRVPADVDLVACAQAFARYCAEEMISVDFRCEECGDLVDWRDLLEEVFTAGYIARGNP